MYIDPNTGGMLFQILAVALAAITGLFFIFAGRIRAAFARLRRSMRHEDGEKTEEKPTE